jgi:hypothetical protein
MNMADAKTNNTGFFVFALLFIAILAGSILSQKWIAEKMLTSVFPNNAIVTDVFPSEWIIITNVVSSGEDYTKGEKQFRAMITSIRYSEFSDDHQINYAVGKSKLKDFAFANRQTLYFVNPFLAFIPLHMFIAGVIAFLLSIFIPGGSSLSWFRRNLLREYERHEMLLRKQFRAHELEFNSILSMDDMTREKYIRNSTLPEVVIKEVDDFIDMDVWLNHSGFNPVTPVKFYFRYRISAAYGNVIQGLVSGGAGVLIFIIGLRGLKLIPSEEPSIILMALSLEFILLIVLMITFAGSAQEERLDRVVKELEAEQRDAIKQQTTTLHEMLGSSIDREKKNSGAESIAEYEERRLLDELLHQMLNQMDRKKGRHGS